MATGQKPYSGGCPTSCSKRATLMMTKGGKKGQKSKVHATIYHGCEHEETVVDAPVRKHSNGMKDTNGGKDCGQSSQWESWETGDKEAIQKLEVRTERVTVNGVQRSATPLLCFPNAPPVVAVMSSLRSPEQSLLQDPGNVLRECFSACLFAEDPPEKFISVMHSTPPGVAVVNSSAFLCSHCCPHDPEKSKFTLNSQLTLQTVTKMAKC